MKVFNRKHYQWVNENISTADLDKTVLSPIQLKPNFKSVDQDTCNTSNKGYTHNFSHVSIYPRLVVQPKLTINQTNDIYEQDADAMADKVMRMPDQQVSPFNALSKSADANMQIKRKEYSNEQFQPNQPKLLVKNNATVDSSNTDNNF